MKAYSLKSQEEKMRDIAYKYALENHEQIAYEALTNNAPYIIREMTAIMLYALSTHGYGEKRLNEIYEWFVDATNMPEVFGKRIDCDNAIDMLASKYNIDFSRLNIHFETWDEYAKRNGIRRK